MYDIYMTCKEQISDCVDCLEVIQGNYRDNQISGGCCKRKGQKILERIEQLQKRIDSLPHTLPASLITKIAEMRVFWS